MVAACAAAPALAQGVDVELQSAIDRRGTSCKLAVAITNSTGLHVTSVTGRATYRNGAGAEVGAVRLAARFEGRPSVVVEGFALGIACQDMAAVAIRIDAMEVDGDTASGRRHLERANAGRKTSRVNGIRVVG